MQLVKARGWEKLDLRASFIFGNRKFGRQGLIKKKFAVQTKKKKGAWK